MTKLEKTKDVVDFLIGIGFEKEMERGKIKKVRAGKGKMRGRKYKRKISLLVITEKDCPLLKSMKNIAGMKAVEVSKLNLENLAPGAVPGRLTLWTNGAIEKISKENLFM
jgi:large subunit ribosomal protein L4e